MPLAPKVARAVEPRPSAVVLPLAEVERAPQRPWQRNPGHPPVRLQAQRRAQVPLGYQAGQTVLLVVLWAPPTEARAPLPMGQRQL